MNTTVLKPSVAKSREAPAPKRLDGHKRQSDQKGHRIYLSRRANKPSVDKSCETSAHKRFDGRMEYLIIKTVMNTPAING